MVGGESAWDRALSRSLGEFLDRQPRIAPGRIVRYERNGLADSVNSEGQVVIKRIRCPSRIITGETSREDILTYGDLRLHQRERSQPDLRPRRIQLPQRHGRRVPPIRRQ